LGHFGGPTDVPEPTRYGKVLQKADHAICGRGNFILCPSHQKYRLCVANWKALSEPQRQRVRHAVFSLSSEGVAGTQQSTSTDGNLTVLHRPDAGKKLGSRRRPKADCTMTQNKFECAPAYDIALTMKCYTKLL